MTSIAFIDQPEVQEVSMWQKELPALTTVSSMDSCPPSFHPKLVVRQGTMGLAGTVELCLQVSRVLKYCNDRRLAVVPQGGNSGLVGGSVPLFDEVILNLGAMDNIISFDEISGILVCEGGCILENVDSYLSERG
jgi:hypothetical protein